MQPLAQLSNPRLKNAFFVNSASSIAAASGRLHRGYVVQPPTLEGHGPKGERTDRRKDGRWDRRSKLQ